MSSTAARRVTPGVGLGIAIVAANALMAVLAPVLAPWGEAEIVGDVWGEPTARSWLGLDNLGRDMLSRIIFGGRTTIAIALAVTLLSFVIGIMLGFTASIRGGWVDTILGRIVDTMMAIPTLIFTLIVLAAFGTSLPLLIGTIAILDATRVFRLSRTLGVNIVATSYFEIARLRGETLWWLITRELLPNAWTPIVAEFGLRFCFAILFIASLSFLGLGIQPPAAYWGSMVRDNAQAISFGGIAPMLQVLAIAQLNIEIYLMAD